MYQIEASAASLEQKTKRASPAALTIGIIFTSVGPLLIPFGLVSRDESAKVPGILGGVVLTGAGIPLIVVGARKVPVEEAPASKAHLSPNVFIGPGSLAMRWQF